MMGLGDNKRLVAHFNSHLTGSDIDAALSLLADDATWWVLGKPDLFPVTGTRSNREFGKILRDVHASLQDGMRMDVVGMVAEGDKVAAELHARATTIAGRAYDNRYHMLYTVRGAEIASVREYTDLMNIRDVFAVPDVEPRPCLDRSGEPARSEGSAPLRSGDIGDLNAGKLVVIDFLELFRSGDIGAVLDMMTDDATWWVNGRPDLYPGARSWTKAEMADVWLDLYGRLDGTLSMDPTAMIAEGNQVAAEARSHAITKAGAVYANDYHLLFTVRDRKIASVREYTDLLHAAAVFG